MTGQSCFRLEKKSGGTTYYLSWVKEGLKPVVKMIICCYDEWKGTGGDEAYAAFPFFRGAFCQKPGRKHSSHVFGFLNIPSSHFPSTSVAHQLHLSWWLTATLIPRHILSIISCSILVLLPASPWARINGDPTEPLVGSFLFNWINGSSCRKHIIQAWGETCISQSHLQLSELKIVTHTWEVLGY